MREAVITLLVGGKPEAVRAAATAGMPRGEREKTGKEHALRQRQRRGSHES